MGKLGGIILLSALALTGCAAQAQESTPLPVSSERAVTEELRAGDFITAVKASGSTYGSLQEQDLTTMAVELCEHYADGFTTEDLRASDGDRLALAGEAARATVCR